MKLILISFLILPSLAFALDNTYEYKGDRKVEVSFVEPEREVKKLVTPEAIQRELNSAKRALAFYQNNIIKTTDKIAYLESLFLEVKAVVDANPEEPKPLPAPAEDPVVP